MNCMILEDILYFLVHDKDLLAENTLQTSSYVFITHDPREKLITKAEFDVACHYIDLVHTQSFSIYMCGNHAFGATFPFYRAIKSASFSFLLTISCWGKLHVRVLNMAHYFLPHTFFSSMGSFRNYVDIT